MKEKNSFMHIALDLNVSGVRNFVAVQIRISIYLTCGELPTPLLTVNQLGCTSPLPTVNPVGGVLQHPCTVPVYKLLFIRQ